MYYSLSYCLYSKTAHSDLSTVLPLTETSGGKPPRLAHSAHVLLSRAEQLKAVSAVFSCVARSAERGLAGGLFTPVHLDHTAQAAGRSSSRAAL